MTGVGRQVEAKGVVGSPIGLVAEQVDCIRNKYKEMRERELIS